MERVIEGGREVQPYCCCWWWRTGLCLLIWPQSQHLCKIDWFIAAAARLGHFCHSASWRGNGEVGVILSHLALSVLQQQHPTESLPVSAPLGKVVWLVCCLGEEEEGSRQITNLCVSICLHAHWSETSGLPQFCQACFNGFSHSLLTWKGS